VASHRWQGKAFYQILGVDEGSSLTEIKTEYRWLARKFHPDHNQGDVRAEKKFLEVTEAYEVLVNPASRSEYDEFISPRNSSAGAQETSPNESPDTSNSNPSSKPPYRKPGAPHPPPKPSATRPPPPKPSAKRATKPPPSYWYLAVFLSLILFVAVSSVFAYNTPTTDGQKRDEATASACTIFLNYPWDEVNSPEEMGAAAVAFREWASAPDVIGSVSGALSGFATRLENYAANSTETTLNALSGSGDNALDRCSEYG